MPQQAVATRQLAQQRIQCDTPGRLLHRVIAHKTQRFTHHRRQLFQALQHVVPRLTGLQQFHLQAQFGQGRVQVMADCRQQPCTAFDMACQAGLHGVEGVRQFAGFSRAGQGQRRDPFASADPLGSPGQRFDRAQHAADAEDHHQQHGQGSHR
ncbi:hypothetical protein D3C76_1026050 [compost metagenome]